MTSNPAKHRVPWTRNHEQSMGIWINEPMLRAPVSMDKAIDTLADAGFGIVRLFLRNSNFTHRSKETIDVVARAVRVAHKRGLRAVLDCEPHEIVGGDMGRQYPDAMGSKLVRSTASIVDGHWQLRVDTPHAAGVIPIYDGMEAAFLQAGGVTRKVLPDFAVRSEQQFYRNGGIHREMNYAEGVPVQVRKTITLQGDLRGVADGTLVAYVRFLAPAQVDFWADGFRRYYDELLECYRHIPLDGVGWDEPAQDGDWNSYRYGQAFARAFERRNDYKLSDKLNLLDETGMSGEMVKVRLDYYRTLNEGLAQAQANLIAKARELFGKNLLLGTHHTWQGEGGINDIRAGAVDYFRLNDNMDAGYTDCSWWDPPSVAYAYTLAASMARLTPSGEAEVNTWHFKPTVANVRRNVNLMSLLNINWFNIWFGSDSDCIRQEGHYTWPHTVKAMHAHLKLQLVLGRKKPVTEVAVWHGWEGVCGWNQPGLANAQKAFCLNTCDCFLKRSIAADFVDSRLIAESKVEGGCLVTPLGSYRIIVVPFALVMPRKAFEKCVAFAKSGGRLVFVGTPVACDESGKSLASDFARLLEMPEMTAEHYMRGFDVGGTLPSYRPQRLEVCRQLSSELPNRLISVEGEIHGARARGNNSVFLTDLDPQDRLIEQIESVLEKTVRVCGGNLLWRLYRDKSGDSLVVVSADEHPLRGILCWGEDVVDFAGGSVGLFMRNPSGRPCLAEGDIVFSLKHEPTSGCAPT